MTKQSQFIAQENVGVRRTELQEGRDAAWSQQQPELGLNVARSFSLLLIFCSLSTVLFFSDRLALSRGRKRFHWSNGTAKERLTS